MTDARAFRGFRFPAEVILWAVRWYLQFPISYRDLERMLADRGVAVDHVTLYRWVQRFAPELEKRLRRHLRPCRGPWHVDETYVRVDGQWRYLYRAVDGTRPDDRLPAQRQAGQAGGQALLPPGARPREHPQPAHRRHRPAQELPRCAAGDEAGWRAVALHPAPPRPLAQQPGRAGPPPRQAPNRADARLPELLDGAAHPGRGRGDGDARPRDRCASCPPTTCRRSGPSSTGSSASRRDRGDALRQLAYGQPTQQIPSTRLEDAHWGKRAEAAVKEGLASPEETEAVLRSIPP